MSANRTAALLIHGLGGTQFDLGSLHKTLKRAGVDTHSLTLPGHGGTPHDLVSVRAEDWLDAVREKYRQVMQQYDTVHVIGMCMGSLLALSLCATESHRRGRLITLAAPVYIDGWATPWYTAARHAFYWLPLLPERMRIDEDEPFGIKNALVRSIVKAKFERGDNFHYRWVPLACLRQVDRLRRMVMRSAHAIPCETLIMHAREDELTSLRSATFLHDQIEDTELVVLENSYHLICVDNDRETVTQNVLRFLDLAADSAAVANEPVEDVPMSDDEVRDLTTRYLSAMAAQRFEAALPLFASNVVWAQCGGGEALARDYQGRGALVDLFSTLLDRSGGTFAFRSFGEPVFDGQTVTVEARYSATHAGRQLDARARETFTLSNGRVARVVHEPLDDGTESAFWNGAGGPAGARRAAPQTVISAELATLDGAALEQGFVVAQARLKALARRPSNDTLLALYACYKQATHGDAPAERPSALDPAGRAKHTAWTELRGVSGDEARRRYIALAGQQEPAAVA
ncbi:alpha/beta hydrolase family protein [Caballeronia hypogeia]|uniref:Alpha/beta hydrolase family protein n=1 Tax=Caballeronia hypogeia TaxID=1777140 RepID=A0A157ZX51_9BURK|nr:acyl-CoA-binding protein [Caballeronia hypogeia]SAK50114.1 alpha/beta hydrolase family protein [Caballeronia hypogeia]